MEHNLYPAARIAESCGISRQGLNKFCREKCPEARVGNKIDINNPVMRAYMESKNADFSRQLKPAAERTDPQAKTPVSQSESKLAMSRKGNGTSNQQPRLTATENKTVEQIDISDHGNLTLNEIVAYFGSDESYRGFLDAKKKQVEIIEKELKVKKQLGELIDRELVEKMNISIIDGFTSRLLTDFCKSAPVDIRAAFESDKDNIEIESLLRKLISLQLNPLVKQLSKEALK